jgi:hypothetical protein
MTLTLVRIHDSPVRIGNSRRIQGQRGTEGKKWYAREDSNLWPSAPEADALSGLSYGRTFSTTYN